MDPFITVLGMLGLAAANSTSSDSDQHDQTAGDYAREQRDLAAQQEREQRAYERQQTERSYCNEKTNVP